MEIQENKQLHLKKKLFENDIGVSTMNNAMKNENTIMLFAGCCFLMDNVLHKI